MPPSLGASCWAFYVAIVTGANCVPGALSADLSLDSDSDFLRKCRRVESSLANVDRTDLGIPHLEDIALHIDFLVADSAFRFALDSENRDDLSHLSFSFGCCSIASCDIVEG